MPGSGWVEAGSLGIGTSLVTRAGPKLSVQSVTWHRDTVAQLAAQGGVGSQTVYNLTVEDDHTFFVGSTGGGTWVHNAPCYTEVSENHVVAEGHSAGTPLQEGQSQFYPGEGGQKFTDEVVNHDEVEIQPQDNGRTRYTVQDLGRRPVGVGRAHLPARGGEVIEEGNPALNPAYNPGDVVTQYPY